MISPSELTSRYFSLYNRGKRNTLFGILLISLIFSISCVVLYGLFYLVVLLGTLIATNIYSNSAAPSELKSIIDIITSVSNLIVSLLLSIISALGVTTIAHAMIRYINNEEVTMGNVIIDAFKFTFSGKGLKLALTFYFAHMLASLGFIFCFVPGLFTTGAVQLGVLYAIDKDISLKDAIPLGWRDVTADYMTWFVFSVGIFILFCIATVCTCFTLAVFTSALQALVYGVFYASIHNKPIFTESESDAVPAQ